MPALDQRPANGYGRPTPSRVALRELLEATLDWAAGVAGPRDLQWQGKRFRLTRLADGAAGARALLCEAPPGVSIPEYAARRRIRDVTGEASGRSLMIFTDAAHSTLVWTWVTRGEAGTRVYRELSFRPGQAWGPLRPVLESIAAGAPGAPPIWPESDCGDPSARATGGLASGAAAGRGGPPLLDAIRRALEAERGSAAEAWGRQCVQDIVEGCISVETMREQWDLLLGLHVYDPACGGGEWLDRALRTLLVAYEALLERMRSAVDDLDRNQPAARRERLGDLRRLVRRAGGWRDPAAGARFSLELALLHNIFGADEDPGRVRKCRSRLVAGLGAIGDPDLLALNVRVRRAGSEPANPCAGRNITIRTADVQKGEVPSGEPLEIVQRGVAAILALHLEAELEISDLSRALRAAERRLTVGRVLSGKRAAPRPLDREADMMPIPVGAAEPQDTASMALLAPGDAMYPAALPRRLGSPAPEVIYTVGDPALLQCRPTAWFTSARLAADLIIPTLELARQFRDEGVAVISGFHSPVERECLDLLLRGDQPVLVCLARGMAEVRLRKEWRPSVERGRMLIITAHPPRVKRPSVKSAEVRNRLAAGLAERVFIAGATPGGRLHTLAREVAARRQPLACFDHPANHDLLLLGAKAVSPA